MDNNTNHYTQKLAIELNGITKIFKTDIFAKPNTALADVSFRVPEGSTFAVLGPNGAGKTTLLKVILGTIKPTSGNGTILGYQLGDTRAKKLLGYLPENPYYYYYLTGYEILNFFADLFNIPPDQKKERIEYLITMVGMEGRAKRQLKTYSKGMLQRIGFASALVNDPQMILLDEPMSGLDPMGRQDIRDIVRLLQKENKTIFFNSHILSDVQEICSEFIIIHQGKLLVQKDVNSIISNNIDLDRFFIDTIKGAEEVANV